MRATTLTRSSKLTLLSRYPPSSLLSRFGKARELWVGFCDRTEVHDPARQLAGLFLVSSLAVPPPSQFTRDIFSGTHEAKNGKYDHGHAPDINDTHSSVPRVNQPYPSISSLAPSAMMAMKSTSRLDPSADFGLSKNYSDVVRA
jgi:hypothetical protein